MKVKHFFLFQMYSTNYLLFISGSQSLCFLSGRLSQSQPVCCNIFRRRSSSCSFLKKVAAKAAEDVAVQIQRFVRIRRKEEEIVQNKKYFVC